MKYTINSIIAIIGKNTMRGAHTVFHTTTGAMFRVGRSISGFHADCYAPGEVLIASHTGLTVREAASLVLRWEAEDEARN